MEGGGVGSERYISMPSYKIPLVKPFLEATSSEVKSAIVNISTKNNVSRFLYLQLVAVKRMSTLKIVSESNIGTASHRCICLFFSFLFLSVSLHFEPEVLY